MIRNFLSQSCKRRLIHTNNCLNQSPTIFYNLSYSELFHHESSNQEGQIMKLNDDEIYSIDTGKFTGRSPKDKWIVKNLNSDYSLKSGIEIHEPNVIFPKIDL